ncbi:MerR family DNA-binding transcriptional regulator [Actinoallomurus iriomotensis]|nr:helix-turn-helix domain-containing protein [Actinoallomurus iriomotensis]
MLAQEPSDLLKPREAAELFGVRTTTIARWAREGKLTPLRTPGGHRRYSRTAIQALLADNPEPSADWQQMTEDAVRLYEQGWSIRQVADQFECSYGAIRRILMNRVTLRNRGGTYPTTE